MQGQLQKLCSAMVPLWNLLKPAFVSCAAGIMLGDAMHALQPWLQRHHHHATNKQVQHLVSRLADHPLVPLLLAIAVLIATLGWRVLVPSEIATSARRYAQGCQARRWQRAMLHVAPYIWRNRRAVFFTLTSVAVFAAVLKWVHPSLQAHCPLWLSRRAAHYGAKLRSLQWASFAAVLAFSIQGLQEARQRTKAEEQLQHIRSTMHRASQDAHGGIGADYDVHPLLPRQASAVV